LKFATNFGYAFGGIEVQLLGTGGERKSAQGDERDARFQNILQHMNPS
jgi:hypothetical protein